MDFRFSEEQEALRKTARSFLEKKCSGYFVRQMEDDEVGFSADLWAKMAGLGWLGLVFPEEYGGAGGNFLDLTVLLEEMGRALLPAPFVPTVVCCGLPILAAGTTEQKKQLLPKIADGSYVFTPAWCELDSSYRPSGINIGALRSGADFTVNGIKLFVHYAPVADYLLVAARTGKADVDGGGVTLFLVSRTSRGIGQRLLKNIAGEKLYEVRFDSVRVPATNILGELHRGWPILAANMQQAGVAQCAYIIGGAQRVLEMTTRYATQRVQYDRPIGSFQAIQHRCADMLTDVTTSRYITYKVAGMMSAGQPCRAEAATAKAWVSEAYRRICSNGSQVHGGIGLALEHDMQLFFRRGKLAEYLFGGADFHREAIAEHLGI